jgi:hypothetical protein
MDDSIVFIRASTKTNYRSWLYYLGSSSKDIRVDTVIRLDHNYRIGFSLLQNEWNSSTAPRRFQI